MMYDEINQLITFGENTPRMPVLFVGHGSPMNAIEENEFVQGWRHLGKTLPRPKAILCVSAHWETKGTYVTAMSKPPTIHDFGGFPKALYEAQYPAPGSPELALETRQAIKKNRHRSGRKVGIGSRRMECHPPNLSGSRCSGY